MIYLVFESSKGRKDLVFVSSTKDLAFCSCKCWSESNPSFTYRVYSVAEDEQTFYVEKLSPLCEYRNGLPF